MDQRSRLYETNYRPRLSRRYGRIQTLAAAILNKNDYFFRLLLCILIFYALYSVLHLTLIALIYHKTIMYFDEWDEGSNYVNLAKILIPYSILFSQHNEHQFLFPRLLIFADFRYFGGLGWLQIACSFVLQTTQALALILISRPLWSSTTSWTVVAALTVTLMFSMGQEGNFLVGFQVCFVLSFSAACAASICFCKAIPSRRKPFRRFGLLIANAAALFVSAFSLASGLACGFALIGVAGVMRAGWKIIAFEIFTSSVIIICYFANFQTLPDQTLVDLVSWNPIQLLGFSVAFLGNLLGPSTGPAMMLGALGVGITLLAVWVVWRSDDSRAGRGALLGIMVFGVLSAGMTALGRAGSGVQQAFEIRYVTPPCIFWSAHLLFWSPLSMPRRVVRIRNVLYPLVAAILVIGTVRGQFSGTSAAKELADALDRFTPALVAGAYEPALEVIDGLDFGQTVQVVDYLKQEHLSLFRDPMKRLIGKLLAEAGRRLPDGTCSGTFDAATRSTGQSQSWLTVSGTARDSSGQRSRFSGVLIIDASEKIVGYASVRSWRDDVFWRGYATDPVIPPLRAYAILDRSTLCLIADITRITSSYFVPPANGSLEIG